MAAKSGSGPLTGGPGPHPEPKLTADYVRLQAAAQKVLKEWETGSTFDLAWALDALREVASKDRSRP